VHQDLGTSHPAEPFISGFVMNDRESYQRMQKIFIHASALGKDERAAYLDEVCDADPMMRAEVEEMLAADREAGAWLERPEGLWPSPSDDEIGETEPEVIGPYRLIEKLGSGGMGVVYLAEQNEPVHRQVALKLIKAGMDTEQVVARFEMERQALAMMEHPGIARVLDAGATDDGRPFFVMEVVRGTPITTFCDSAELTIDQRLELFSRVCDALQHAHQKGIIHRDIKPSNVLVESRDGEVVPKIIDFGIAKATDPRLIDGSQQTALGQVIGTPEYMSPEQAELSVQDIDTRTDIYSMGVLLYVLLSGSLPFSSKDLRSGGFGILQRSLLEDEPPKPSTRVSSVDESGIDCGIDSRVLVRKLRGDLDWIVMKAIDRVPDRRYQSASELAADVRRYLADEPVLASAPGTAYKLRKFVRRHRVAVTGVVAGILLLLGGVVATTSQAIRATRAEREARLQAALAADVNEFLVSMLAEADPANHPAGREVTVVEALDQAAAMVEVGDRSPRLEAEVRAVVGETYYSLSRHEEAELQTRAALEILRTLDRLDPVEVARLENQLGAILVDRGDTEGASLSFEAARDIFAAAGVSHVLDWAGAVRNLADVAKVNGDLETAAELCKQALDAARTVDGDLARTAQASALIQLGDLDLERMDVETAERRIREGLTLQRTVLGELHPTVADSLRRLAMVLSEKGQFEEADALFHASLETIRSVYGEGHIRVAVSLQNFGFHLLKKEPEMAEPYLQEAVEILVDLGNDAGAARALDTLAAAQLDLGYFEEAEKSFSRALELRLISLPADHPDIAQSLSNLGTAHMRRGRYDRAEPMFEQALEMFRRAFGGRHPQVAVVTYNLGSTQSDAGRLAEGLVNLESAVELAAGIFPDGHLNLAVMRAKYGECLSRLSRFADAEVILIPAHTVISGQLGDEHWRSRQAADMLAELYTRWGKPEEAEPWQALSGS